MEYIKNDRKWVITKIDDCYMITYYEKFSFGWRAYSKGERYSKSAVVYEFGKKYAY